MLPAPQRKIYSSELSRASTKSRPMGYKPTRLPPRRERGDWPLKAQASWLSQTGTVPTPIASLKSRRRGPKRLASGLNGHEALAFDSAGNLFVVNTGDGTVVE